MADAKVVRLRSVSTGVVVATTEENASRLPTGAYEPADKSTAKKSSSSKTEK